MIDKTSQMLMNKKIKYKTTNKTNKKQSTAGI